MKDRFIVAAMAAALSLVSPVADAGAQTFKFDTLRVLTYNIHGLLDEGDPPNWDPTLASWLTTAIIELDPDIVGFQEVLQGLDSDGTDNEVHALVDSLRRRTGEDWNARVAMSHVSWDRFEEGIAILSKHPIVSSEEWALESRDVFQRKLLMATIETPVGAVDFFTTHLAYRGEADSVRIGQVSEIKQRVAARASRANPAIVVGDFNAEPDQPPMVLATTDGAQEGWSDTFSMLHQDLPGFTFSARDPSRRIDYVFVGDATVLVPVRSEVALDDELNGRLLSDHLGVLTEFVLHPSAGRPR